MPHDIVIHNGNIVDGNGTPAYEGSVAIDGDEITAVGEVNDDGRKNIDADGLAITPGFVDLHTHFDAQAGWDPFLTPVSWHGVTTALFGNCGVTFAPCKPADRDFLAGMMETVEDIPKNAILTGLAWDWVSYGEYLDSIEKLNPAINITGLVGHCASRFYVMGERSITDDATDEEIEQIAKLVGDSVRDGAIGFSSNRLPGHTLPDGRSIPGTYAKPKELVAIAKEVGKYGGIMQNVLNYAQLKSELDIVKQQTEACGTRMLFSAPYTPDQGDEVSAYEQSIEAMHGDGLDVNGLTLPRSGGFLSGLHTGIMPFRGPNWDEMRKADFAARLSMLRDSNRRGHLIEEGKSLPAIIRAAENWFYLGDDAQPQYTKAASQSIAAVAADNNEHPVETYIRLMLDTNGEAFIHMRFFNNDLDALPPFLKREWVLPGIGDAGAHVSQIMDSGWTSFMLSHWVRNKNEFTLEEAIRKLTSAQARIIGFHDRGSIEVGKKADINVLDPDRVAERQPKLVHDFPDSAPRLIQKAVGYKSTIVNGTVILEDDDHTGERSGRILRNPNV